MGAPARSRYHLQGATLGHWYVRCYLRAGYWLAVCTHCGATQEARFDATTQYLPRCHSCGAQSSSIRPQQARAKYLSRGGSSRGG